MRLKTELYAKELRISKQNIQLFEPIFLNKK